MYRLLVVDDEPAIVLGLYKILQGISDDLDVYTAYSSKEALEIINKTKIDILLSDINMPGMNGITLREETLKYWEKCKVIFLTGLNDFEYLYSIANIPNTQYILKSETDDIIIEAVNRCVEQISMDNIDAIMEYKVNSERKKNQELLKKTFIYDFLNYYDEDEKCLINDIDEYELSLKLNENTYILVGKINEYSNSLNRRDRSKLLYEIEDITKSQLDKYFEYENIVYQGNKVVWILQLKESSKIIESSISKILKNICEECQNFITGILKVYVSFAFSEKSICLKDINKNFTWLNYAIEYEAKGDTPKIIPILSQHNSSIEVENMNFSSIRSKIDHIDITLANKKYKDVIEIVNSLSQATECRNIDGIQFVEAYLTIVAKVIKQFNSLKFDSEYKTKIYEDMILREKERMNEYILKLCKELSSLNDEEINSSSEYMTICKLERYIADNLGGDLSLDTLGGIIYLNPSYLSRFYKKIRGVTLSDYIRNSKIEKSKELLLETNKKISDIAEVLGFESSAYFSAVFRKAVGMPPAEYRNNNFR